MAENNARAPARHERIVFVLRWIVLIPACLTVVQYTGWFFTLLFAIVILVCSAVLHTIINGIEPSQQFVGALMIGLPLGTLPGAVMAHVIAPKWKDRTAKLLPVVITLLWLSGYVGSDFFWPLIICELLLVGAVLLLLSTIIKPTLVVAAMKVVFKDQLSDFDKDLLVCQLGMLTLTNSYLSAISSADSDQQKFFFYLLLLVAALGAIGMPITYFSFREFLTQQGRDNSKLLNIINALCMVPLLYVVAGAVTQLFKGTD